MFASPPSLSASSNDPESSLPPSVPPLEESSPELEPAPPLDAPELTPDEEPPELDDDPLVDPSRPEPIVDVLDPPPQPTATTTATIQPRPKQVFDAFIDSSPW
jgi:hypothetical protein